MHPSLFFLRVGITLSLCFAVQLLADGFRNPPVGAGSQGRFGGNFVYTPDASAISLNPANLVDFTENAFLGSLTFGYSKMEFTSAFGPKIETEDPWALLPAFFWVMPAAEEERWSFGLGITSPYGRSSSLPSDNPFSSVSPYYTQLMSLQIAPAFATRLSDKLSVGFSVNLLYSELDLRQKYPWALATGVPGLPEGATTFNARGTGVGATLSFTYQATDHQRLAFRVQSPTQVKYRGDMDVTAIPPGFPALPQSDFETEITFPLVLALGYGIQLTEALMAELEEKRKMAKLGQASRELAHDLSNPLTVVISSVELLARELKNVGESLKSSDRSESAMEYITVIEEGLERCTELLGVWRNLEKNNDMELTPCPLLPFLAKTQREAEAMIGERGIQLDFLTDGLEEVVIQADPLQLHRTIINLLGNAMDAVSPKSGVVTLNTFLRNHRVCIEIADNGPGVPEDLLEKIFEPYFTTKEEGKGTGLGLFISQRIVERHGGALLVRNAPEGGAIFQIELPFNPDENCV